MRKHSMKDWVMAVRPWSFPASAMPVAVTLAYLWWMGQEMDWVNGIWALLTIVVFHAAGNTWSDYFDYRRKVDTKDSYCVQTLTGGLFEPCEIFRLSLTLLAVALAGGLGLLARTGWPLLCIGIGGVACALLYPPLKYRALGDVVIFIAYALLPMLGTAYVTTGAMDWSTLWLALPVGLITVAILHANNTRDIPTDHRAHIRTLAMALGGRVSVFLYAFEVLFPFGWIAGCAAGGVLPWWTLLTLPAIGLAGSNVRQMRRFFTVGREGIVTVDECTAQLQLLFSVLLIVSFVIARVSV